MQISDRIVNHFFATSQWLKRLLHLHRDIVFNLMERRKCNFWKMAPTLTKSVSFLPLCNSLIDGSFKLGRRSSKKMDPFFGGGVARGEKLFLHLAGSYHSFLRRFRSPVATFHLQDNKYPKSNFSTTFSFTALPFSLLVPSNYQWHFATTRN